MGNGLLIGLPMVDTRRSLVAAYELTQRGFTSVSVMKGGYFEWANSGREVVTDNGPVAVTE